MKRYRATFASLICASLIALTGCGGEGAATTATSAPPDTTTPSSTADSATSPAAAETTASMSDKELCESAKKAGDDMKAAIIAAMKAGKEPSTAEYKKILTDLGEQLTTSAAAGGDSKVATALRQVGAEVSKAAAAADPEAAIDNPAFDKAGADLSAGCKAAGVDINF